MTAPILQFRVAGLPTMQGSKTGFVVRTRGGKHRAVLVDQGAVKLKPWREAVRSSAVEAAERSMGGAAWTPELGPVRIDLWFALPRPVSAPKRRRTWPTGGRSGDLDKLARACLDSLTDAGIVRDDAQCVELRAVKDWPTNVQQLSPGVIVRVWRVDDTPPPPTTGQIPLLAQQDPGGPTA